MSRNSIFSGRLIKRLPVLRRERKSETGSFRGMVFLKVLRSTKEREKELRLLILGLDNAGKTTCVKKLNGEPTDTISPTVGFAIKSFTYGGFQLNVWDVGGQKTIRSFWKNYFEGTDGVIWVVDSADVQRLEDCRKELQNLLKEERLSGAGLLILANKQDLGGALDADSIATHLELQAIRTHRWLIQPCSARTGQGLEEGVSWLVTEAGSRVTG